MKNERQQQLFERDEALSRVMFNAGERWQSAAMRVLGSMRGEVTGEDIRIECLTRGVKPHHHNAWGGFIMGQVRSGKLIPTGKRTGMRAKRSHARKTPIYRINH